MPHVDAHQPGTPCWFELSTTDTAAAKTFYAGLFGWSYFDSPMGPDLPPYILARVQDRDAAAVFSMMKEQREQGMPPFWLAYFAVANVDQMVPKVTSLGGQVMTGPMDVPDAGRMAVCLDPAGGAFAMWQPGKHPGARIVYETGAMCWVELLAKELSKSEKFYAGLFGWSVEKQSMGPVEYTVFKNGEVPVAGMYPNPVGTEDNVPQNWLGYFQIANCDDTTDKAKATGGKVWVSPQSVPGVGRFAVLADAQGASFGILQAAPRT
jgi:predicted enzyme related to lactoylglutathione lyase